MNSQENTPDVTLDNFTITGSVDEQASALTQLIKSKRIFSLVPTDSFREGLRRLEETGKIDANPRERLKAIATLERARSVLKKKGIEVQKAVERCLERAPESLQLLNDADDRTYVAKAMKFAKGDWVASYVAREAVFEPVAEKSRVPLLAVLLQQNKTLAISFDAMASQFEHWASQEEVDGNAIGRRLKRVLAATRLGVRSGKQSTGDGIGDRLRDLVRAPFRGKSAPNDLKVAKAVASEIASLADDIVHARISLVVDSEMFGFLNTCKRWFPLSSWAQFSGRSESLQHLSETIAEGIRIGAVQGLTDQKLMEALELATGTRQKALTITTTIADSNPGLSDVVQSWLRKGRVTGETKSGLAEESALIGADQLVAMVLIEAESVTRQIEGLARVTTDDSGAAISGMKVNTTELKCKALIGAVRSLAKARAMRTFGEIDGVITYSAMQHVSASGPIDTRLVRVERQGVERIDLSGNSQVVMKAIVEPIKS